MAYFPFFLSPPFFFFGDVLRAVVLAAALRAGFFTAALRAGALWAGALWADGLAPLRAAAFLAGGAFASSGSPSRAGFARRRRFRSVGSVSATGSRSCPIAPASTSTTLDQRR